MATLTPVLRQKFTDANGLPLAGGKLYSYQAGTTTPLETYTDSTAGSQNTNPIILDANGECDLWIGLSAYKFVLKNSSDVTQWTVDNATQAGNLTSDIFSGTGAQTAFTLTGNPGSENNTIVFVGGVYQQKNTYSVSGTTLTFSVAPSTGTNNIEVMTGALLTIGTPSDATVTKAKFAGGAPKLAVTGSKTSNYSATSGDDVISCDSTGGAFTVSLPVAASNSGMALEIIKTDSSLNAITIDGNASETINGAVTTTINTQYEKIKIVSNGSNWLILERRIPSDWIAYTPSFTGFGTTSGINIKSRRVLDSLEVTGYFVSGTSTATPGLISLGFNGTAGNVTIDTAKIAALALIGTGATSGSSATFFGVGWLAPATNTTTIILAAQTSTINMSGAATNASSIIASGQACHINIKVPIVGWNS